MSADFDADAYFHRIGYRGPRCASLQVLRDIHALHPAAITFENLDVLLRRPISLEPGALAEKMVRRRRGGYCFEQNTLLMVALEALGFSVRGIAGRVQWNAGGRVLGRNHMALLVTTEEGDVLADVGFGGLTLTAPLRLEQGVVQQTPHGVYRLLRVADEWQLQAQLDRAWAPMYQLSLAQQAAADWEVANWFAATAPESIFTRMPIVARPAADGRYAMRKDRLRHYRNDGTVEERPIATAEQLAEVLRDIFNLTVTAEELAIIVAIAGL